MRATRVAENIPAISDSLFDVSGMDPESVIRKRVHEYGLMGITGPASATFHSDGSISSEGNAKAYSGNLPDLAQLDYLRDQGDPNVYKMRSPTYGSMDDDANIGMAALARIALNPDAVIRRYGKWTTGRAVKSMVQHTLDHKFSMILSQRTEDLARAGSRKSRSHVTVAMLLRTYPQITPEYVEEHEESFEVLKPFFCRRDKKRIEAAEAGKGPSFAKLLAAEAAHA